MEMPRDRYLKRLNHDMLIDTAGGLQIMSGRKMF